MGTKKKTVLMSSSLWTVGGVESHIVRLSRLLAARGAEVLFATRNSLDGVSVLAMLRDIPVTCLTTPFAARGGRASTLWSIAAWPIQLRDGIDVLYSFDTTWFAVFLSRFVRPGGYVIGTHAGPPILEREYVHTAARSILDGFLVESELQIPAYTSLGVPVRAIPHLPNTAAVAPRPQRQIDNLRVAFMGRLDRNKGMYRLLEIWPTLNIDPATLDIYGDGMERSGLENQIRGMGLQEQVQMRGAWTPEQLPSIMENIDLVVLPSDFEGVPLVLLECMAYGVPFVASDVGAVRSLAQDNPDVRVVPLANRELAMAIEEMARKIRAGELRGERLQQYFSARYGDRLADQWVSALMQPEEFWGPKQLKNRPSLSGLMLRRMSTAITGESST
jgi:glycosyltransferase involved in cell wall biosynthesis